MKAVNVAVIGAGTMGRGIAQQCAIAGLKVFLVDLSEDVLAKALTSVNESLRRLYEKERIDAETYQRARQSIFTGTDYAWLAEVDVVIEAATENLTVKVQLLKRIENACSPDTIIATNTSSLSVTALAGNLTRPHRFIGMHFFNPVPVMQLVEVIRAMQTDDSTYEAVVTFCTALGKKAVTVRDSPGFLVNRLLCPMINEAIVALDEGVACPEDIDTAMKLGSNHPIGPLTLADMIGLDTLLAIMHVLHHDFGDAKYRPARLLSEMVSAGRLGRKSGRGFYEYPS